jgi:toxin YoeB
MAAMYEIAWCKLAAQEYDHWQKHNPQVAQRIDRLIESMWQDAFRGIGKPEPLKHDLQGLWTRRITGEHRILYQVSGQKIVVIACCDHT